MSFLTPLRARLARESPGPWSCGRARSHRWIAPVGAALAAEVATDVGTGRPPFDVNPHRSRRLRSVVPSLPCHTRDHGRVYGGFASSQAATAVFQSAAVPNRI